MITEQWYIDGVDGSTFGVYLTEGSYRDLVCLNSLKEISYNDWQERDGIDPDLSAPVLDAKTVVLDFALVGSVADYDTFLRYLTKGAYHTFRFPQIGLETTLRLTDCGDTDTLQDLKTFSLTFSEDTPLAGYTYAAPSSDLPAFGDYLIDGVDVASYGIRILSGTYDSLTAAPTPKQGLTRNISVCAGVEHDGKENLAMKFKSRTARLHCWMCAKTLGEFWRNRNALLFNLAQPEARTLTATELGKDFSFYYKSCSIEHLDVLDGIWCKLTLDIELFKGGLLW